jgi:DNA-binding protein H-NS
MSKIVEELRKKLESMSQEELDAEWEQLKHYNDCGPTVDEYFEELKKYGLYPKELENEDSKD